MSADLSCGQCGTSLQPASRFCHACGAPTVAPVSPEPAAAAPAGSRGCALLVVIALVLLGVGVGGWLAWGRHVARTLARAQLAEARALPLCDVERAQALLRVAATGGDEATRAEATTLARELEERAVATHATTLARLEAVEKALAAGRWAEAAEVAKAIAADRSVVPADAGRAAQLRDVAERGAERAAALADLEAALAAGDLARAREAVERAQRTLDGDGVTAAEHGRVQAAATRLERHVEHVRLAGAGDADAARGDLRAAAARYREALAQVELTDTRRKHDEAYARTQGERLAAIRGAGALALEPDARRQVDACARLALVVRIEGEGADPARKALRALVAAALERLGFVLDDEAPIKLVVEANAEALSKEYKGEHDDEPRTLYTGADLSGRLALDHGEDRLTEIPMSGTVYPPTNVFVSRGEYASPADAPYDEAAMEGCAALSDLLVQVFGIEPVQVTIASIVAWTDHPQHEDVVRLATYDDELREVAEGHANPVVRADAREALGHVEAIEARDREMERAGEGEGEDEGPSGPEGD